MLYLPQVISSSSARGQSTFLLQTEYWGIQREELAQGNAPSGHDPAPEKTHHTPSRNIRTCYLSTIRCHYQLNPRLPGFNGTRDRSLSG